jgi:hypothetical protein
VLWFQGATRSQLQAAALRQSDGFLTSQRNGNGKLFIAQVSQTIS